MTGGTITMIGAMMAASMLPATGGLAALPLLLAGAVLAVCARLIKNRFRR